MKSIYGLNQGERTKESQRRGGRRGHKQRVLAGKQLPIKMHPAHTVTPNGIEIGPLSAATRLPDGTRR